MRRPVVGIIGNAFLINDQYPAHAGGTMNSEAVAEVSGCLPLLVPSDPRFVSVTELLDVCDGFLLTGGRPNVHPEEYGEHPTPPMVISTVRVMRLPCRWCAPVWNVASRFWGSVAAFRK